MNSASFYHPVTCLKDAGAVIFYLESIAVFHKTFPDLSIRDGKMPGEAVYIIRINQQDRSVKPVTAITGAIVTVFHVMISSKYF